MTTYLVKICGIQWETDGEDVEGLPSELTVTGYEADERPAVDDEALIERMNNFLSDTYGWLVSDYSLEVL